MPLFESAASKARKEREAVEDAARVRQVRQKVDARINDLKARPKTAAARTIGAEQRQWARKPAYNVASAIYDTGAEVSCRVVDLSFGGMRVEFFDDAPRPDEFALTVPTLRFVGIVQSAWSNGAQSGVEVLRWRESA